MYWYDFMHDKFHLEFRYAYVTSPISSGETLHDNFGMYLMGGEI